MDATQQAVCELIRAWARKESGPVVLPEGASSGSIRKILSDHYVEAALAPLMPENFKDVELEQCILSSRDRTAYLLLELERLLPAITYESCRPVVLKGAGLAQTLYADPGQRWFVDLDILVPKQELDEVCRRLTEIGYLPFKGKRDPEYYEKYHLHRMMVGPQGSCLEIHWDLTLPNSVYGFDVEGVFDRAETMSLGKVEAFTSSAVDQIFHGVYQNIADGFVDLRRILDFVLIMESMTTEDWLYLIKEAARTGMSEALALSLHVVKGIAEVAPPAQFSNEFQLGRANARIFQGLNVAEGCLARNGEMSPGYTIMLHLLLTPSYPHKFRESYLFLLPSEEALMNGGHWGPDLPGLKTRLHHVLYHMKTLTVIGGRTALALAKG